MASLIDYNTVLYEDDKTNGMQESVGLFEKTTKNKVFKNCALILILNKDDLLRKLLASDDNGLVRCFSEEGNWPLEEEYWNVQVDEQFHNNEITFEQYHDHTTNFILGLFQSRNNLQTKIYPHITIATENHIVKQVFQDIQAIMVKNAMKQSGYFVDDFPQ